MHRTPVLDGWAPEQVWMIFLGFEPPTSQLVARRYVDYAVPTMICRLCYIHYATPITLYRLRYTNNAIPTTLYRLRYTDSDKERTESENVLRLYQTRRCYISQDRNFSRILTVWGGGGGNNSHLDNFRFFFEHRIMNFLVV